MGSKKKKTHRNYRVVLVSSSSRKLYCVESQHPWAHPVAVAFLRDTIKEALCTLIELSVPL
jgi:hypothetical protein